MGKNKTSASFYRRGIPNSNYTFGSAVLGNYQIVQPQYLFLTQGTPIPQQIFGKPTIMFPSLYGAPGQSYSQSNPGAYNTIIDNKYYLNMASGVKMNGGATGEYNVYQEYNYNFKTANVTVNVSGIQSNTSVYIFRKAFTYPGFSFISEYYVIQQLVNGINNFMVSSKYGINNVGVEQIGIIILSPSTGNCTCNVLGVNISYNI